MIDIIKRILYGATPSPAALDRLAQARRPRQTLHDLARAMSRRLGGE